MNAFESNSEPETFRTPISMRENQEGGSLFDGQLVVEQMLAEQQSLTAVERFSRSFESGKAPAQAKFYSSLLPAAPPKPGQQYAFQVDLDRCSGCKACVTACHTLNGLDEKETWRDVGLLMGGTNELPVLQHVTTACHHCVEPACMAACPVNAYEKHPVTGIVRHLDDQCFGCQYCTLACPYEVPKYHAGKGIVRKCDMCSQRLAVGEAPACVQACPHEAISIQVVEIERVVEDAEAELFLPGAPDPQITLPTTTYKTDRVFPRNTLPADFYSVRREHAHWPLIVMLVLTQLSVGAFLMELVFDRFLLQGEIAGLRPLHTVSALFFGMFALSASLFHLGRPQYAYRAILGLRHSWLSREILAFGIFAKLSIVYAGFNWLFDLSTPVGKTVSSALGWSVAVSGLIGVFCSVMIYVFTQRPLWTFSLTASKFLLTTLLLGTAAAWLTVLMGTLGGIADMREVARKVGPHLCRWLIIFSAAKLLLELSLLRHWRARQNTFAKRSALLQLGELSNVTLARFSCGMLGGIAMPLFLWPHLQGTIEPAMLSVLVALLFCACLAGEVMERYMFFTANVAPRMPGKL